MVHWAILRGRRAGAGTAAGGMVVRSGSGGAVREWWLWVVDFQVSADSGGDGAQVAFV
jgi:hypothetical protein